MEFPKNKVIIGLTGGIGCGKSTVLDIFQNELPNHYFCLCADDLCHNVYKLKSDELNEFFEKRWGQSFLDKNGIIRRGEVAKTIFNKKYFSNELNWLGNILHPFIFEEAQKQIVNTTGNFIIFDIPLLYESNLEKYFSDIIGVWSDNNTQEKRLLIRGYSSVEMAVRKSAQLPAVEKLERADYGIINNGSLNELIEQCKIIDKKLRVKYDRKKTK